MTERAEELFSLIEGPSHQAWLIRTTAVEVGGSTVALARDPHGRPAILVPARGRKAESRLATRGLSARVGALADGEKLQDWLIITCQSRHLDSTFFRLCDDVLIQLADAREDADVVESTLAVVARWQSLLAEVPSELLSEEQCAGLLAELHALEVLAVMVGPSAAMTSWVGHDRARVDFRFADTGLEVKATLKRDRFTVTIHGLMQLDDVGIGDLYLFAQQLERVPSGGDSIPDAIGRLVAAGTPEADLRMALDGLGYSTADEGVYEELRFETLHERGVQVGDGTPRIVRSSFATESAADSVSAVTYAIDLTDLSAGEGRLSQPRDAFAKVCRGLV